MDCKKKRDEELKRSFALISIPRRQRWRSTTVDALKKAVDVKEARERMAEVLPEHAVLVSEAISLAQDMAAEPEKES